MNEFKDDGYLYEWSAIHISDALEYCKDKYKPLLTEVKQQGVEYIIPATLKVKQVVGYADSGGIKALYLRGGAVQALKYGWRTKYLPKRTELSETKRLEMFEYVHPAVEVGVSDTYAGYPVIMGKHRPSGRASGYIWVSNEWRIAASPFVAALALRNKGLGSGGAIEYGWSYQDPDNPRIAAYCYDYHSTCWYTLDGVYGNLLDFLVVQYPSDWIPNNQQVAATLRPFNFGWSFSCEFEDGKVTQKQGEWHIQGKGKWKSTTLVLEGNTYRRIPTRTT